MNMINLCYTLQKRNNLDDSTDILSSYTDSLDTDMTRFKNASIRQLLFKNILVFYIIIIIMYLVIQLIAQIPIKYAYILGNSL